ncbi:MAG: hypothetical protein JNK04_09105 [Myxococcales bacterium]|nr:hypothetical protein [Myxococcales bacterium]
MNTTYVNARRPLRGLHAALTALFLGSCLIATTGCDALKKMADEKLQEELKKDSKKKLEDDASASGSAKAGDKPSGGNAWTDAGGASTPLARVKLDAGGMKGLSMMAPEGAEVKASLGGRGADVQKFSAGFAVWVLEDGSVTLPLIKDAASAKYGKDAKIQHEDANSIIIGGKSPLGDDFYAYMGFFKAPNGKIYRCETEQSQAGSDKSHAEAIDKLCESLELDGKALGGGAAPASPEKVAENTPQSDDPTKAPETKPAADTKPASDTKPTSAPATPAKTSAPAPTQAPPPAQPAPTQAAPTAKPTAKAPPPPPAKKERTRK